MENQPRDSTSWSMIRGQDSFYSLYVKRLLDLCVAMSILPLILPVMGIIAIAILLDSEGNPLFIQERIGKDGQLFHMVKFRTMYSDYDREQDVAFMKAYVRGEPARGAKSDVNPSFKPPNYRGRTRVGRLLRATSLDELPQIFNVLRGEMSFVGPRPNVPWEVEEYQAWHCERLKALPGITGLAQVNGRSNIPFDELVKWDIEYVRNINFWLDTKIIWRTVSAVLQQLGAG